MTHEEEIAALKAKNACQREQISSLVERARELEARLSKDSRSKPHGPPVARPRRTQDMALLAALETVFSG
jgi:hypothetical protein